MYLKALLFIVGVGWIWKKRKEIFGWEDDENQDKRNDSATLLPTPPPTFSVKPIAYYSPERRLKSILLPAPSYERKEVNSKPVQNVLSPIPKPLSKPTLPSLPTNGEGKLRFARDQKGTESIYMIPDDIKHLIEKNIIPQVLRKPLSPSTYKDYFAALLYAEDFYMEKWSKFHLSNVKVKFSSAAIYKNPVKKNCNSYEGKGKVADEKMFAVFEIDKVREKRPFLLSRDFVFAGPPNTNVKQFQGFVYGVVGGNSVAAEFQQDFHSQHHDSKRYDISFSFNRECLKRAHKALESALDHYLMSFLFPTKGGLDGGHHLHSVSLSNIMLDQQIMSAIHRISSFPGTSSPFLVKGPLCLQRYDDTLSQTGKVIYLAVLQMYRTLPDCRILICAPKNKTCDVLMRSLRREIAEPEIFRANAAFREVEEVPDDIRSSCPYERECFVCPPVSELQKYKVILSTFMSASRLRRQGMRAGHFTHIFLVDASSATEPETIVALAGLVDNKTSLIVTGEPGDHPYWIRSNFARQNGLNASYFGRLCNI